MSYPKICNITPEEYQHKIVELSESDNVNNKLSVYQTGMSEEAGDVSGVLNRYYCGDADPENFAKDLKKEIGDMIAYAVLLADIFNIDFEDILIENLEKIELHVKEKKTTRKG